MPNLTGIWSVLTATRWEPRPIVDYYGSQEEALDAALRGVRAGAANGVNGEIVVCRADLVRRPGSDWYLQSLFGRVSIGYVGHVPSLPSTVDARTLDVLCRDAIPAAGLT